MKPRGTTCKKVQTRYAFAITIACLLLAARPGRAEPSLDGTGEATDRPLRSGRHRRTALALPAGTSDAERRGRRFFEDRLDASDPKVGLCRAVRTDAAGADTVFKRANCPSRLASHLAGASTRPPLFRTSGASSE